MDLSAICDDAALTRISPIRMMFYFIHLDADAPVLTPSCLSSLAVANANQDGKIVHGPGVQPSATCRLNILFLRSDSLANVLSHSAPE
jgi:hypothetical protein